MAVGDFNGDGKLDLAVPNADIGGDFVVGSVSILLGNGDGTFQPEVDYAAGSNPSLVAVGDFNGDGRLDMVVADLTNSTASVLLQPGLIFGPDAFLSSTSLIFATQLLGTVSPVQSVQLTNYGTAALNLTGIAASTNFGETDNCGSSLAAGASCNISLTFAPTALDNLAGTLSVTDDAPGSPQTVSLNGVGTVVKLVPGRLDFTCTLVSCPSKTVTLTNTGATALSVSSITITNNKFAQTNNCPTSLGAGQSCTITVGFFGNVNVSYIGALLVKDNGGGSPQTVSLRGIVTP